MEIKLQYLVNTVALLSKNDETAGCVKATKHRYRVIHKKLSHKTEDKMQEKIKMILQVEENLAHI